VHFASYLEQDGLEVVSASPERLVRVEDGRALTRPIAGTRRKGTPEENARFIHELRTNEKEQAEHAMLVDLERNDLGRVCAYGSVQVTKLMEITEYAHVIHIESEVVGRLAPGVEPLDVVAAVFPGGTITGVPKIRTQQIITELEPQARGLYTGSLGYLSFTGELDLNIVIRTMVLKDGRAWVQVGGGIVQDSEPRREYQETLHKARSLLLALSARPVEDAA
jgi:anthranilate/para-aminobenzoate synthase component I